MVVYLVAGLCLVEEADEEGVLAGLFEDRGDVDWARGGGARGGLSMGGGEEEEGGERDQEGEGEGEGGGLHFNLWWS